MALAANHTYIRIFHKDLPDKTKYGGNDYIGHRYSDSGMPLQEPLNIQDENTHFWESLELKGIAQKFSYLPFRSFFEKK